MIVAATLVLALLLDVDGMLPLPLFSASGAERGSASREAAPAADAGLATDDAATLALAAAFGRATGDPAALALAESTLEKMGGRAAWDATRYLRWNFSGRRLHHWDRKTDDVRIESEDRVILMNLRTKQGRVVDGGVEIDDPAKLREALDEGYAMWVNDSYWLLMPYKLLDAGVHLKSIGPSKLSDGRPAQLIGVTFTGVGLTPQNRYDVWIADDTGLVEQWSYYETASDKEPKFTLPWAGWKRFGRILLATDHGRGDPWEVAVPETLPRDLFAEP